VDAGHYLWWVGLAQLLWVAAFAMFLVVFLPMWLGPRVDGQPGLPRFSLAGEQADGSRLVVGANVSHRSPATVCSVSFRGFRDHYS